MRNNNAGSHFLKFLGKLSTAAGLSVLFSSLALSQPPQNPGGEMKSVPAMIPLDKLPEFEVADIRANKESGQPRAQFRPGGRLDFQGLPIKFMVMAAWGYENDESRVTGGPGWVGTEKYDIVAKAPPNSSIADLRLMLRSVLMKRFGLEIHVEDKMLSVYLLEKGKGEPKLTPSKTEGRADCSRSNEDGLITAKCHNMTMDELANGLPGMAPAYFDKPVVNLTGIDGTYDFAFSWSPRGLLLGTNGGGGAATAPKADGAILTQSTPGGGMTVFEGIDKGIGLRLNSAKHGIPIIVIDKVNRTPTEN
jgi:uncharacterized protein (TIGR03435 family)